MGSMTDYLEDLILDHICNGVAYTTPGTVYSALFTAIPSDAGGGTEVPSDCYTRQATTFCSAGATTTGSLTNTGAVTFPTCATAYTVVGWSLQDAETAGNMLYWATVTTVAIGVGDQATFAAGGIVITQD